MIALSACASSESQHAKIKTETKFSSEAYGVAASPRVVKTYKTKIKRGGGRYQVGKAYKIRGKTYRPSEQPNYDKVGTASWYGPNFHGRLTANGEIFDMNTLSAAHTTLPLPSYARVTNLENNRSVVVRVNDRGPFAHNRIIDLSSRAADLLDVKKKGVAKVRVEYVGKARLDGQDVAWLESSYRGGKGGRQRLSPPPGATEPGASYPGTQIAQADITPPATIGFQAVEAPEARPLAPSGTPVQLVPAALDSDFGTTGSVKKRKRRGSIFDDFFAADNTARTSRRSSYAPTRRVSEAHAAINQRVRAEHVIHIGFAQTDAEIERARKVLADLGDLHSTAAHAGSSGRYHLTLRLVGRIESAAAIRAAQYFGYPNAGRLNAAK